MTTSLLILLHLLAIAFTFWYCTRRVARVLSTEDLKKELEELVIAFNLNAEKNISLLEEQEKKIEALLKKFEKRKSEAPPPAAGLKENNEVYGEAKRKKKAPVRKISSAPLHRQPTAEEVALPTSELMEGELPWEKYLEEKEDSLSLSSAKPPSGPVRTKPGKKKSLRSLETVSAEETLATQASRPNEENTSAAGFSAKTLYQLYRQGNSLRDLAALTGLNREEIKKQLMLLKATVLKK